MISKTVAPFLLASHESLSHFLFIYFDFFLSRLDIHEIFNSLVVVFCRIKCKKCEHYKSLIMFQDEKQ